MAWISAESERRSCRRSFGDGAVTAGRRRGGEGARVRALLPLPGGRRRPERGVTSISRRSAFIAALRADDGRVFAGANVENAAYGLGNCAERAAVAAAITAGARTFDALALVSDGEAPAPPCGACRQVLAEFAPQLLVTSYGQNGEVAEWTVDELLPHRFRLHDSDGSTT